MVTLKFGKHKGKALREVPSEYLQWITETSDPDDPKYGQSNKFLIAACHDEINKRMDAMGGARAPKAKSAPAAAAPLKPKNINQLVTEVQALIDALYKHAARMKEIMGQMEELGEECSSDHLPF